MTSALETFRVRQEVQFRERTPRSRAMFERTQNDPRPPGADILPYPITFGRGSGTRLFDVDRNEYLDLCNDDGQLVHGHAHPRIGTAITEQVNNGLGYGDPAHAGAHLADLIVKRMPHVRQVRFLSSRAEATMMAVRAARAFTGRGKILKIEGGYHGGYDGLAVSVDPGRAGLPWPAGWPEGAGLSCYLAREVLVTPFNDVDTLAALVERHSAELAAVIVEPVLAAAGMIPAEQAFVRGVRDVTREHDVLLIVDEAESFRLAPGGGQEVHDIDSDLTTLGPSLSSGLAIGALGGRTDVMELLDSTIGHTRFSRLFNPNAISMSAGLVTLQLLSAERIDHINALGDRLRTDMQTLLDDACIPACVTGAGSLGQIHFTEEPVRDYRTAASARRMLNRLMHLALLNRGIIVSEQCMFAVSTCTQDEDISRALSGIAGALNDLKPAIDESESRGDGIAVPALYPPPNIPSRPSRGEETDDSFASSEKDVRFFVSRM